MTVKFFDVGNICDNGIYLIRWFITRSDTCLVKYYYSPCIAKITGDLVPMLGQCWSNVCDAGPTSLQHRVDNLTLSPPSANIVVYNQFYSPYKYQLLGTKSSHHPQEVLLAQFSLYVHKGGLKPDSFHLLGTKCPFKHRDFQMFGLKLNKYE